MAGMSLTVMKLDDELKHYYRKSVIHQRLKQMGQLKV